MKKKVHKVGLVGEESGLGAAYNQNTYGILKELI